MHDLDQNLSTGVARACCQALVGGAQRNKLLRAYIRKTVKKGEAANAGPWEPAD